MAKTTILFGSLFIALGLAGYVGTGSTHLTALIPAFFGILLSGCGFLAQKENLRKHAMHGAAMIGLLGILGTLSSVLKIGTLLDGSSERPAAVISQLVMLVMSVAFLTLCVRSFIAARKAREAAGQPS